MDGDLAYMRVRDPTCRRGCQIKGDCDFLSWGWDNAPWGLEGSLQGVRNRNRSLPCPIGTSEEVISDHLIMGKAPLSSCSRLLKGKAEVSLEPDAKIAFSSKQSAYHGGPSWGDLFSTPTRVCYFEERRVMVSPAREPSPTVGCARKPRLLPPFLGGVRICYAPHREMHNDRVSETGWKTWDK